MWKEWRKHHQESTNSNIPEFGKLTPGDMNHWFQRFVLEIRKKDGTEYPPNSLLHICLGLFRHLRTTTNPNIDFKDTNFTEFRLTLDAEMKRLQKKGLGTKTKKAEIITEAEEDKLWEKGELGDKNPQALLNTIVYMIGLYFALRSGTEHRNLRFEPSQIQTCEREGERPYLLYTEDTSKNRQGGLKG